MSRLEGMKGKDIVTAMIRPLVEQKNPVLVTKLVDIESGGIWVEGKDLAEFFHAEFKQSIIPRMPIFFVPFAQIAWVSGSADYPSLSEKGLGL